MEIFAAQILAIYKSGSFLIKVLIASLPIIPVGFFIYQTKLIEQFRNLEVIGWMSLVFGVLLYISDKRKTTNKIETNFDIKSAIIFGLFQVLALIPGVSRSGITITSGRFLGFNRFDSAKISFFLAIPALGAASLVGVYNVYQVGSEELNFLAIIAVIFSAIFSYITIVLFLGFVKKFSLKIFIFYRIILSLVILSVVYL